MKREQAEEQSSNLGSKIENSRITIGKSIIEQKF